MPGSASKVARAAGWLAVVGWVVFAAGPALAYVHVVPPLAGLVMFLGGGGLAMLAAPVGVAGILSGIRHGRSKRPAWLGLLAGLLAAGILIAAAPERGAPAIHDVSTDTRRPPRFERARELSGNRGRDMAYPPSFAPLQRKAYPDVRSVHLRRSKSDAFRRCVAAARAMGWRITAKDAQRGHLEATATTPVFHFVDDIVVRVQGSEHVSSIDVRTVSRTTLRDPGLHAARIREFFSRVRG